jgi:hypothetical protein
MDLTEREHALILTGIFELRITHLEHDSRRADIEEPVETLGGDLRAMFFSGDLASDDGA